MSTYISSTANKFDLVFFLAINSLRRNARQRVLGYAWWFLEPGFQIALYFASFGLVLGVGSKDTDYLGVVITGVVTWRWFTLAIPMGTASLAQNIAFLRSFPISTPIFVSAAMLDAFVKNVPVVALMLVYVGLTSGVSAEWMWFPAVLLVQTLLIAAIVMNLSWLVMYLPDINQMIELVMRAALFLSGVFYVVSDLTDRGQFWLFLNPFAVVIQGMRDSLMFHETPDLVRLGIIAVLSLFVLVFGIWRHMRLAGRLSTRLMY